MQIKNMFVKPIDRDIKGVIKVGSASEENRKQELEEYVVTDELKKHLETFFTNYVYSFDHDVDKMGVWISGFFGSGKSHFLKILSYILDDTLVDGRHAMEYFSDKEAITSDPELYANMQRAAHTPTLSILFNVDSKSQSTAKSDSNAIVTVFNRVFNEKLGYDGANPALADLERTLDEEGRYEEFKAAYKAVNGVDWLDDRSKIRVHRKYMVKALTQMGYMSEEDAQDWVKSATTESYKIALEDFAARVATYIKRSGKRVVFLVDEIGQFISSDSRLMLNLQTITEELGSQCHGKAWIIVTAQEAIDSMTDPDRMDTNFTQGKIDFSKIQGRFNTRLSLTSINADEVIRQRILKKTDTAEATLKALYSAEETSIQNVVDFRDISLELTKYKDEAEFAADYPFLPYQFKLLADILEAIRKNSSSGRHQSSGERSMLGAFQKAAITLKEQEEGALVPLYLFYNDLDQFIDHTHAVVIKRAEESERINPNHEKDCFAVNVLKVLFLLKYVDGVPLTETNIVNFMVTNIHEDKAALLPRVQEALQVLIRSLMVAQVQDTYEFLTDEEQDINREIQNREIPTSEVIKNIGTVIFDNIYKNNRYRVPEFNGAYVYAFNKSVDEQPVNLNQQNNQLGIRFITPYYGGDAGTNLDSTLGLMSVQNNEVIFKLPENNDRYIRELKNNMKIHDYLRKVPDPQKGKSTILRATKNQEAAQSAEYAKKTLAEAIGQAEIFINNKKITEIKTTNPEGRINEALGRLVDIVYFKLAYITKEKNDQDIKELFKKQPESTVLMPVAPQKDNEHALEEMKGFIKERTDYYDSVSFKDLIDYFAKPPYGYNELDTRWLAAELFKEKELSAYLDKEPVSEFNRKPEELAQYFTVGKFRDKLLFKAKEVIPPAFLNSCKTIMKDLLNKTVVSTDPDKIRVDLVEGVNNLKDQVKRMQDIWKYNQEFPGNEKLGEISRALTNLQDKYRDNGVFKYLNQQEDDLLDLAEDLAPVQTFYRNENQQTIFRDNGLAALKLYDSSKIYLRDQPVIQGIYNQIHEIVTSRTPYGRIKDLPALFETFRDLYMEVLTEKTQPVLDAIQQNAQTALDELAGKEYETNYTSRVLKDFNALKENATHEGNISKLIGYQAQADSLCESYLNEFARKDAEIAAREQKPVTTPGKTPVTPPQTPKLPKKKVVLARYMGNPVWKIHNQQDLDAYITAFKKRLEENLKDLDELQVKF